MGSMKSTIKRHAQMHRFPDHQETFQTIQKISRPSGNLCIWACLLMVDFIDTRKNFPDAQKLSRWQCHHETWAFLTLAQRFALHDSHVSISIQMYFSTEF